FAEGPFAGSIEERGSEDAAEDADWHESREPWFDSGPVSAIAIDTGGSADHQRQRAGGVGGFRGCSKKEERRESDDGATSGDGVDCATGGGGEDQADDFGERHLRAERKHPANQLKHGENKKITGLGWTWVDIGGLRTWRVIRFTEVQSNAIQ